MKGPKLTVVTIVGTRPEIIRLSRVISSLDIYCDHRLIHTGQNYDYELNKIFFEDLDIREPDIFLNCASNQNTPSQTIGNIIIEVEKYLLEIKPEAVLILGDTNSCLSVIPAKRLKIPIFHMEAGNRCFDLRVPEEINRKIVDHTSDINITYSSIARDYLIKEGFPPDQIIKVGSPMNEVISYYSKKIYSSSILKELSLDNDKYFLVSVHREENIDCEINLKKFIQMLNYIANSYAIPVVVSAHPRTRKKIDSKEIKLKDNVTLIKPLGFSDYNKLQISAKCVLSDSGTINEEASILNFRALNLRESHERPEAMEETSVMMVGMNIQRIIQGLEIIDAQLKGEKRTLGKVLDYSSSNVSDKIIRIIHSYTDYVNRVSWKKYQ